MALDPYALISSSARANDNNYNNTISNSNDNSNSNINNIDNSNSIINSIGINSIGNSNSISHNNDNSNSITDNEHNKSKRVIITLEGNDYSNVNKLPVFFRLVVTIYTII